MLCNPQKGFERWEHNIGGVGATLLGTSVTTGAASSTKGAVAELITSTSFDSYLMRIVVGSYFLSASASDGALDILVGASTEEVLIPNLLIGGAGAYPRFWDFPLYVPANTRIAAQAAGRLLSTAFRVGIFLYGGDGYPKGRVGTKVTTYGMGTVPNGTAITCGASGAEGAWAQITAGTTEDHFALIPSFQVTNDSTQSSRYMTVDLGVGAATEEEVAQSYWYASDVTEFMCGPMNPRPCFLDIPNGTRLSMRASNGGTIDAGYDGVIHAVS